MNQTLKETFSYFGSNPFNRYQSKRGSTRNTSPIQENSLRIREIAQQNIYIMFPNARDPLTGIASQNNRFNQKINSKSTTQLPKLQAGQENFSKTISTRASLTQKTFNKTILEIGEKNETLVKPFMTTKRSEVNQIQGMFKSVRKSPKQDYFGLDNSLEYDFPFHQIVDFVKNHSQGFENKQNTDLHKHYQRMYIKNKFKIKKLRHDKKERIIKIRERMIQDNKQLEERRLQIQQMLINHSQSNKETTKSNNKTPLQVKQFILQQNIKDLSEFDEILNKYEQYFQTNNKESVDSEIKKEDFNRLRDLYNQTTTKQQEVQQFQYKEGGLLHKLMIKQNQKKELHVVKTQNDSLAQRDLYEDYKKSVKTVEDIFIEQIIYFIRQKGIVALSPVDYFNFRGILINRKNQYKQMLLELDDIIDIKRHIKYNTEGQRKKKQEEQEEEQAKFYITQEQSSIVRKSQIETNDQTYQDSILNYKNSLSTSIGTERAALHPKILEFIPPNSFLPRLQDQQSLSKRNFQMNSDFYNSFKNNTSIENNSNNINDSDKFGINNDQSSMFQLSTHRIEDNNSIKKIIEEGMTTERGKSVQNLTERSKESQDEYDADLNQLQYLMELNNQNENTERDQEEAMRMKLQIIKLMMKDDKKSIMKKLTERILSKIEQRREVLLRQIEKEENKEKLEELQQELQREIKKKNVQLLLLTHTNSLKKVSHRLMYEYDQQAQYYRELSNSASLAGSELVNSPTNEWQDSISPLAFETIFNLIDDADDVVANFVINQMDKQGTLENLLNHLKIQESQTGTIDIDKVKDYILMVNNSIPQEEIKNLEMKNGKIVGRIKKQEKNRKSQEQVQIHQDEVIEPVEDDKQTDQAEKQEQENPDYYKFYQKNKPEKIQIRLKDKTSDESRKMRLKSDQSPHDSEYSEDASGLSADNVSRTSKKDLNKRQIQNSKSIKNKNKINVYQDLNNSKLKDLARVGSFYSETSQSSNNIRSKQNSNFQRELINNESTARKEVLLNLKGYENAQDILLGEFTAEEQIKAQEELRLRREEEQRKIKTIGKKMNFTDNEDDPELQRLKELIQFSETQKRNQTFNVKMQHKKTNKSKFARSNSQVNEENQLQVVDQQQQQQRRRSTIDIPQISQIKYGNKSGSKLGNGNEDIPQFYKDLLKGKSKQNDVYEEIEIEVTDTSDDDDDEPQYDENGKLIPKQKKKKKKILLVKKGENGAITLDLQQQLPQGFKITKDGKIVKVEKVTLEDGTVIEIEKEVKQNKLRSLIQDENGNMIQKVENLKIKKFKVVKRILENGTVEETEVTDNESELNESISTDKISVSIDESASRPLTPNTRQQMIYEKQKKKKEQMKQELNDSPRKKKKIIKRVIKSNGEIEEIITEVDDPIGGEEIQEYDSKGNLTKQLFIPAEQKKDLNKKITKKQTNSPSSQNTAQNNGGSTKNKKKQKENVQEEWFNEDGTPWVSSKNKKNQGGANNQEGINSTTNRRKQDSNASNLSKTQKIEKEVKEEAPKPPEKIKQIINGREIEYMPLASNESFHSEDIPSSLIDDSQSIKSADLNQMDADKKKMYQKIKKKREQAKQKKIREQLEKEIKDFRKNNVFTELEQLMKQNLSLRELKRQIEVYLEMLKGKNIDDETKYNIFLYLQRKEQLVTFLIAFEDNFESNVMIRPEVMQEIRQFLKKRVSLVKADNEKKMKFTRPVVMPDGNGLSLFEEFKGDNISEWEIRQIMKYASYNQDVQKIIDRLRKFKQDTNAIIQLKLMLKRLETKVIQTDLDYLHIMNLNEDYIQDLQNGDNQDRSKKSILYQSKDKIIKDTQDQFNQKIEALRKCKQKNPEKFQGLLTQFQTVKSDSNIFKALKNEIAEKAEKLNMHTAKVTQAMWTNRMKNFGVTKVNFNMVKTQKIPNV
ncbi:hypothetical protein ABPG72_008102 [Tetrahymena utriculariae]